MNDATIRPVLLAWVAAITGINAALVVWVDQPRPFAPSPIALVEITSSQSIGTDQTVYDQDTTPTLDADNVPGDLIPAVTGMRQLVVQIAVEGDSLADGDVAHAYLERARRRMRWATHRASLRAANLALVNSTGVTTANYTSEDRRVSRAVLDVMLACAVDERLLATPDRDAAIPYIASAGVTSHVSNEAGNQVGTPPQFADLEIP